MTDQLLRAQISELIREKAPRRLATAIEQCVKESLVLNTTQTRDDRIATGKSKLGGRPDLPSDVKWPVRKTKPLSFIAQINLSDLPSFEFLKVLPKNGILSFSIVWEMKRRTQHDNFRLHEIH